MNNCHIDKIDTIRFLISSNKLSNIECNLKSLLWMFYMSGAVKASLVHNSILFLKRKRCKKNLKMGQDRWNSVNKHSNSDVWIYRKQDNTRTFVWTFDKKVWNRIERKHVRHGDNISRFRKNKIPVLLFIAFQSTIKGIILGNV